MESNLKAGQRQIAVRPSLLPHIPLGIMGSKRVSGILMPFKAYCKDGYCMEVSVTSLGESTNKASPQNGGFESWSKINSGERPSLLPYIPLGIRNLFVATTVPTRWSYRKR